MAKFLRRFSELVAIGQSASYLRHAAGLIDELVDRVRQTEEMLRVQTAESAGNLALRARAEAGAEAARAELASRDQALADLEQKLELAEEGFAAERSSLTDRLAHAEARQAAAEAELRRLRAQLAPVGRSHAIVPLENLRLLRAQFTALAADCQRRGDVVSAAMCQVGICGIERTLTGDPPRRPAIGGCA